MSARPGAQVAAPPEPAPGSPYPPAPVPEEPHAWALSMIGHADPGLLPRVVALVAKLGLVPESLAFTRRGDELARIDLCVAGLSRTQAEHLRLVCATMPAMRAVELSPLGESGR